MQSTQFQLLFAMILTLSIVGCSARNTPIQTATPMPGTPSMTSIPQAVLETIEGSFRNQITLLEENMPRSGSEAYMIPSADEQAAFSKLVSLIQDKEFGDAMQLATANYYRLNYYMDRGDDSAASYLLREQRPIQKGWGLYAFRVDSTSNIIVEAPHPLHDRTTPSVAMDIYRALDAHALLIAGAHRHANQDGSADVAHAPESIFQSVHESLVQEIGSRSENAIVLQIHGFHTSKHAGYPPVVIGFGKEIQPLESSLASKIEDAFAQQGIEAGLCIRDGLQSLCGRTNVQGSTAGIIFIHIEMDEYVRKDDQALIAALTQIFSH